MKAGTIPSSIGTWKLAARRDNRALGIPVPGKVVHMPKPNPPYPPEFRQEAVRLARSGDISISRIARDLGIADQTFRNWIAQADVDEGRKDGLTSAEREELKLLREEVKVLREEREILKEAAAFFAKETGRRR